MGTIAVLNTGEGDLKISFDAADPAESIRAKRIVTDMLRRGYALLVEVERNGEKAYERAIGFREDTNEYIIADFDPEVSSHGSEAPAASPAHEAQVNEETPKPTARSGDRRGRTKAVPAEGTNAVAVGRSAGG